MTAAPDTSPSVEQRAASGDHNTPDAADRAEWLEWRRHGIGASDVAGIIGVSPWASPWSVWADKQGLTEDSEPTDAMRFGQLAERVIGPWFTERTGLTLRGEQSRCVHDAEPWMRCTLDGIAVAEGVPVGVVEMKATSRSAAEWADEIPIQYRIQASWQCAVTGHDRAWFAVLHLAFGRLQFEVYDFAPDPDDVDWLTGKARSFWFDHVVTGVPPEADDHTATSDAISAAYGANPEPSGVVEADDDAALMALLSALKSAQTDKQTAEKREKGIRNKLRARLGDAEVMTVGGKPAVSWKAQNRAALDVARLKDERRDVFDEYVATSTHRVLRAHKNEGVRHG